MLTYLPPLNAISSQRRTLVWVDREGRSEPLTAEPRGFYVVELSPDGTKVALDVTGLNRDVWTYDLSRDTMTRLTLDPGDDTYPVWTPDGRRLIMGSSRDGGPRKLYVRSADGTGPIEPLSTNENHRVPMAVSPDGHALVFTESGDLGILSLTGEGNHAFSWRHSPKSSTWRYLMMVVGWFINRTSLANSRGWDARSPMSTTDAGRSLQAVAVGRDGHATALSSSTGPTTP